LTEEEALTAIDRNCGEYGYTWENGSGKERYLERLARGLEKPWFTPEGNLLRAKAAKLVRSRS